MAAARAGRPPANDSPLADQVGQLAELPHAESDRWIDGVAMAWMGFGLGRDAAFTASELAAEAGTEEAIAGCFLQTFSVEFGARADQDLWRSDLDRAVGGEIETMRQRPVLSDANGQYLPATVDSVFYGLRDTLTDGLKSLGGAAWTRFSRHRSQALERRALAALAPALDADWAEGGVRFTLDEDGTVQEGEADALIRADNLLVIVETKSGSLAPSARRAAPARLERGLKDLVVEANEQLQRAHRILTGTRPPRLLGDDGEPLDLNLDGISRTLRIAVTLEDLSPVTPALWQLQQTGLLPTGERAPWVVGVHELELICDLVDRPSQLVQYISRRARSVRQRIWAMDEMDFFMRYLQDGLYFEDEALEGVGLARIIHQPSRGERSGAGTGDPGG